MYQVREIESFGKSRIKHLLRFRVIGFMFISVSAVNGVPPELVKFRNF